MCLCVFLSVSQSLYIMYVCCMGVCLLFSGICYNTWANLPQLKFMQIVWTLIFLLKYTLIKHIKFCRNTNIHMLLIVLISFEYLWVLREFVIKWYEKAHLKLFREQTQFLKFNMKFNWKLQSNSYDGEQFAFSNQ